MLTNSHSIFKLINLFLIQSRSSIWVNTELSKVITMKCCQEHATKKKSESLTGIKPMT